MTIREKSRGASEQQLDERQKLIQDGLTLFHARKTDRLRSLILSRVLSPNEAPDFRTAKNSARLRAVHIRTRTIRFSDGVAKSYYLPCIEMALDRLRAAEGGGQ